MKSTRGFLIGEQLHGQDVSSSHSSNNKYDANCCHPVCPLYPGVHFVRKLYRAGGVVFGVTQSLCIGVCVGSILSCESSVVALNQL